MDARSCGECTLCCKLMGVPEIPKPSAKWCADCDQGVGCRVYDTRPPSCRNFQCFWSIDEAFPDEFRPDRIGALAAFNDSPDSAVLHVDPAKKRALTSPRVDALIKALLKTYSKVFIVQGKETALMQR